MKKTLLLVLLLFLENEFCFAQQKEEFNILLIHVDDLGWADLGVYGSDFYDTPHLDKLAGEGMLFTHSYAAASICSPTRAAMMTGAYPARVGITDWIRAKFQGGSTFAAHGDFETVEGKPLKTPVNQGYLPTEELTLAERLKDLGYSTFHVGKWHLGEEGQFPENQGFDLNFGGNDLGQPPSYFDPYQPAIPTPFYELRNVTPRREGEFLTDREGDELVQFIQNQNQKFFIHWAPYAVHTPIMGPAELIKKYKEKTPGRQKNPAYAALVENLDQNVGKVLAELDLLGLTEKTLVIFTSDNGGLIGNPANPITDNFPLRSQKGYPYEGGIRVPTLVKWPSKIQAGQVVFTPIITMDWTPTLLDYLGQTDRDGLDGKSLKPLFEGQEMVIERDLFWHFPHYRGADVVPHSVVRSGDYKLIYYFDETPPELYDLENDPMEKVNLAAQFPSRVSDLKFKLENWWQETGARLPEKN